MVSNIHPYILSYLRHNATEIKGKNNIRMKKYLERLNHIKNVLCIY